MESKKNESKTMESKKNEPKTLLITGGLGYIGSHTIVELCNKEFKKEKNIEDEYEIIIADACFNSSAKILPLIEELSGKKITFYEIDLCIKEKLEEIFKSHKIYGVIHFAGLKAVNESIHKPLYYYNNNIVSTLNLVDLCLKYNVNHLIFSSSTTVYGGRAEGATEEETLLFPVNPYGRTKLFIEHILKDIAKANPQFKLILLRYCNPVAAHPSGKIGENPKGAPNNLFPIIESYIRGKRKQLFINGNDYPTKDGTCIRDFIHVVDIAKAHVLTMNAFKDEYQYLFHDNFTIFNVGSNKGYSVYEIFVTYAKVNNISLKWEWGDRREGDVPIAVPNCSKIQKEIGFIPKFNLEEMCRDSYNFVKAHPDGIY